MWHESLWKDRCIYRPVRDHYKLIDWTKEEFDPLIIVDMKEFEYVKNNKTEETIATKLKSMEEFKNDN